MTLQTVLNVLPIDGNGFTGPTRMDGGMVRIITPTVDVQYGEFMRYIYVGTAGNVSFVAWDGTTHVLVGLVPGILHWIGSVMINSVGTTATGILVGS